MSLPGTESRHFRLFAYVLVAALAFVVSCAPAGKTSDAALSTPANSGDVANPDSQFYKPFPLLWETSSSNGVFWSAYAYQIIGNDVAETLLAGSDDVGEFCPAYVKLNDLQRVNFWAYLVSGIAKFASGFDTKSREIDREKGLDAITGRMTYAEGLLRLSYQDVRTYQFCAFDWHRDKDLAEGDSTRSIFDPIKNLDCGIKIFATQIAKKHKIAIGGSYWKFLKPSGSGSRIADLMSLTRQLPFCKLN